MPHITLVFNYDTENEYLELIGPLKPLWDKKSGLRLTGISHDSELRRVELIHEAIDRVDDHYDFRETVREIGECPDLDKWSWNGETESI